MTDPAEEEHFKTLFEHAPISLWEEDYSNIKRLFDELRQQGVISLDSHMHEHPGFVDDCIQQMRVLDVNQQTLSMFKADSKEMLLSNLGNIFRDGMRHHFRDELLALWNGDLDWSGEGINYTLAGEPLDIILHWRILPDHEQTWERVLVTIEDVTLRKNAERRFQNLFESSPISLWEEDYSALKAFFDTLRAQGIVDLQNHLRKHPEVVGHCTALIKVLNVNKKTVELFKANSKEHLLANLNMVFRDEMREHFARELVDLWNGKLTYEYDGINYALDGEPINIKLDFRIMPGYEESFGWALMAIQDITARKKAEEYLRYLGTRDVMTGLYNRAFFEETITKLENQRTDPLSIIIADLNHLKHVNDTLGHQGGDKLIRRAAEALTAAFDSTQVIARIGGDEFAIIMPDMNEELALEAAKRIQVLIGLNNKYYSEPELSISLGSATSAAGLSLEKVINMADDAMYHNKGEYHRRRRED